MELLAGISIVSGILGHVCKPQFHCVTRDVSLRGMKLLSDRSIPEGASVKLWVTLPDEGKDKDLTLRGRVCWSTARSVAGKFFAGVSLDTRPGSSGAMWMETIREKIRMTFQNVIPTGAIP